MEEHRRSLMIRLLLFLFLVAVLGLAARSHQVNRRMQQAQAALSSGLSLEASRHVAEAARYQPWRSDLWELAGRYALQAGDYQAAIDYLERANQQASLSTQGLVDLGDAYRGSGDLSAAIRSWEEALAMGEHPGELTQRLAAAHLAQGDDAAAIARLEALVASQPDDAQLRYQLGLLLAAQDPEAALEHLGRAAELDPALESPVSRIRRGVISARFAEDPAYTLLTTGRALATLGEWSLAAKAFRTATQIRPDYAEAWAYLGEARQHLDAQGDNPASSDSLAGDGLAELRKALELDPQSLAAHTFLALYWSRQGHAGLALPSIRAAIALDPENPFLRIELGIALAQTGDLETAYSVLQEAISLAPGNPLILRQVVAFLLHYDYRIEEFALPAARRLVILEPRDPANLDAMAQVLIRLGDLASAERFLKRALRADPDYAPAHLHLGLVHILRSDRAGALKELNLASALDPDGPTAAQARRMLETYFP